MIEEFLGYLSNFWEFIKRNKKACFIILSIYLVVNINIGLAEFPYIDDIGRQLEGYSGFSEHYSRYLSEISARLIQGGSHLTDPGLSTNIISAFILTFASVTLLFVLFPSKKVNLALTLSSTVIGINPWFLEALSFRFDNPFMSLSILVSLLPFIFWESKKLFNLFSIICIYLMCNSYQASSGIYIMMVLTLVFLELIYGKKFNIKGLLNSAISYIIGMVLYKVQITIKPPIFAEQGKTPGLFQLPSVILGNAKGYLKNIYLQSSKTWIYLVIVLLFLLIVNILISGKQKKIFSLFYTFIWLSVGSVISYGAYLALPMQFYLMRPRYEYGLGAFISIILVVIVGISSKNSILSIIKSSVSGLFVFYMLTFSFIYVSTLKQQNTIFETQSSILGNTLNKYVNKKNQVVNLNKFLPNSPIYENTSSVYPLIGSLVMPNTNISWDMTKRFNSLTKLDVDFKPFDTTHLDSSYKLLETTKLFDLYSKDEQLYLFMK
ncbi:glucosyltransferase domain-containing protein [uncultured Streptococcus sp.]|uniref:glucosyltransferase domain-containing protein n=1 Tax=uncultured Streptococcus sp. TaxID=83427 RepID=UPI0025D0AC61|nr:glucosyltransferase domain-containing protein [uncultured Streptococcus sp.]